MRTCENRTVDLGGLLETRRKNLCLIAVVGNNAGNIPDHGRRIDAKRLHAVIVRGDAVRPRLQCHECLIHPVDGRRRHVCPLATEGFDGLNPFKVDGNLDKHLLIDMTEHRLCVAHHPVIVRRRHLDMQGAKIADDGANLPHVSKERDTSLLLDDARIAGHPGDRQIFRKRTNLIEICRINQILHGIGSPFTW